MFLLQPKTRSSQRVLPSKNEDGVDATITTKEGSLGVGGGARDAFLRVANGSSVAMGTDGGHVQSVSNGGTGVTGEMTDGMGREEYAGRLGGRNRRGEATDIREAGGKGAGVARETMEGRGMGEEEGEGMAGNATGHTDEGEENPWVAKLRGLTEV